MSILALLQFYSQRQARKRLQSIVDANRNSTATQSYVKHRAAALKGIARKQEA